MIARARRPLRGLGFSGSPRSQYEAMGRPSFYYNHRMRHQFLRHGSPTNFSVCSFPARTVWNEETAQFEAYAANDPGWGCVLNPALEQLNADSQPDANWSISTYVTLTLGATTGPFPGTAVKMTETTENSVHYAERSAAVATGVFHQMTAVVKAAGRRYVRGEFVNSGLWGGSPIVTFDLVAGTHNIEFGSTTYGAIVPLGDGWYACSLAKLSTGNGSSGPRLRILDDSQTSTYTGNGVDGIFVRSVFFGTTSGQFIPMLPLFSNDGATESQAKCQLAHEDAALFDVVKNEGSVMNAFLVGEQPSPGAQREWFALNEDDDPITNGIWQYATSGNFTSTLIYSGDLKAAASANEAGYPAARTYVGLGSTWLLGDKLKYVLNGVKQTEEGTLNESVSALNQLRFGVTASAGSPHGSGHLACALWPNRISNAAMERFTSAAFIEGLRKST